MRTRFPAALLFATLATCGTPQGEGTLRITVYGEPYVEVGIPPAAFDDGWAVRFDSFQVHVQRIEIAGQDLRFDEAVELSLPSGGAGHLLDTLSVEEGRYAAPAFTIAWVRIAGRAAKGEERRFFDWTFDAPARYHGCETALRVEAGREAHFEITLHADHLFADSLVAEEPRILFDPLAAADRDRDGVITQVELAATDTSAYDPGSLGGVDDLWAWLGARVRSLAHVDGEGHCHVTAGGR